MISSIVIEFERVTKYPLLDFLTRYRDFMINSYPAIDAYFSGDNESIDNAHLVELQWLDNESNNINAQFKNFSSRFKTCGYWELQGLIDDLNVQIEKIKKLPKFRRTSLTSRGYKPVVQVDSSVGSYKTVEDLANSVQQLNQDNTSWIDLMIGNDMNELDWEIDKLHPMTVYINNTIDLVVNTVLDQPIGVRVYGIDIKKKITFTENDVEVVKYQDNVEQKVEILLTLTRGDVPENLVFGRSKEYSVGTTFSQFSFPVVIKQLQETFLQNDLFEYINVKNYSFDEGSMQMVVEIKTKYDYKTEQTVTL